MSQESTHVAKPLSPAEAFEQKVIDDLRENIGKHLPEETLRGMVETALQKLFWERKKRKEGTGFHAEFVEDPSWFEKEVGDLLKPLILDAAKAWLAEPENAEKVLKIIKDLFDRGAASAFIKAFDTIFEHKLIDLQSSIRNEIEDLLRR